jgi:hypothetical protein
MKDPDLSTSGSAVLATIGGVVGTGTVTLGPGRNNDRGPASWKVTGVIVSSSRPGTAPIPRLVITDEVGVIRGISYDGSFDSGACEINMIRGQFLTATWTAGQNGDVVTMTISGTKR